MNNFGIVKSSVYVNCPIYKSVKKVYIESIPDVNLHRCTGCDDMCGLNSCTQCSDTILKLLSDNLLKVTNSFQEERDDYGTFSNPLHLK